MTAPVSRQELVAACQRLVEVARAQASVLEADDFVSFDRLVSERDLLQRLLEQEIPSGERPFVERNLRQVAELDRATIERVRDLLRKTAGGLAQVRQGRGALVGYARPGRQVYRPDGWVNCQG